MTNKKLMGMIIACIGIIAACKTSNKTTSSKVEDTACPKVNYTYNTHIKQIMDNYCAGCHSGSRPAHKIDLSNYEMVKAATAYPRFIGSMEHKSGFDKMPKGQAKLDAATIKTISCWIANGAPN
jgi:hypothetical protein